MGAKHFHFSQFSCSKKQLCFASIQTNSDGVTIYI
jgi:hypothetical protein